MKSKNSKISPKNAKIYTQTLREKAELIAHDDVSFLDKDYSPEKMRDLLQELHVHQIEFELQNEELRSTQTALETERMRYVDLYDLAPVGYCTLNEENVILQANLRTASLLGVTRNHLLGLPLTRFIQNEDQDIHYLCRRKEQGPSEMQSCTLRMVRDDRTVFWARLVMTPYKNDQYNIVLYDVTEDKKQKEIIARSQREWTDAFDGIEDAIMLHDKEYSLMRVNKAYKELSGAEKFKDIIGKPYYQVFPKLDAPMHSCVESLRSGKCEEETFDLEDGRIFKSRTYPVYDDAGEYSFSIHIFENITERKQAEKSLRHANRALKTLSAANMALVQARSEGELLQRAVDIIVKEGGYSLAVVDYAEDNQEKTIIPMVWSGLEGEHYWINGLSWSDTAANQMPLSKVIRTATMQFTHNIAAETEFALWRNAALARGYTASIALPLIEGDKVFGALNIYSSEVNRFKEEEEEVRLLNELANNLTYGIITLRTRVTHEQQAVILRESLEQSIQTIAATVEARDPYTAGHQKHVGELATAIAKEMDLSEKQVNGIHLAAIIHDLGKIHIPAEILSKPGKLSSLEFMMIQTHPQEGYNILKDVKFPWPIADIILQHHEKLDGSGYPQGLKGDQILLEAKIITVADVVEAMSSHRPYRASLGIEAALNEIKRGRGTIYEASVVDACLKLFTEKGFVFSSESF